MSVDLKRQVEGVAKHGYMPYGGFRDAPTKFTSEHTYKGRKKKINKNDMFYFCWCKKRVYMTARRWHMLVFPSHPYMAMRDKPLRHITIICPYCGKHHVNKTLEQIKEEVEEPS